MMCHVDLIYPVEFGASHAKLHRTIGVKGIYQRDDGGHALVHAPDIHPGKLFAAAARAPQHHHLLVGKDVDARGGAIERPGSRLPEQHGVSQVGKLLLDDVVEVGAKAMRVFSLAHMLLVDDLELDVIGQGRLELALELDDIGRGRLELALEVGVRLEKPILRLVHESLYLVVDIGDHAEGVQVLILGLDHVRVAVGVRTEHLDGLTVLLEAFLVSIEVVVEVGVDFFL